MESLHADSETIWSCSEISESIRDDAFICSNRAANSIHDLGRKVFSRKAAEG